MNLPEINDQIAQKSHEIGRNPAEIALVAVSKKQPIERVEAVLAAGHRIFGENRVQEAEGKWPALRDIYPEVQLHLIGPLQSNKVRQAMDLFDVIETVDRLKLAKAIARIAAETGECPKLFVQVNSGEEPQKAGIAPADLPAFLAECADLGLNIQGLMCIPPSDEEPSLHFALLRKLAERHGLSELSMGMSGDFETAIGQGATQVRVGSAIFGARPVLE